MKDATVSFIQSRLNIHPDTVGFRTGFSSDVTQHAFVRQQIVSNSRCRVDRRGNSLIDLQNGVPVANAVANVAFNKANKVVSFGSSFVKPSSSYFTPATLHILTDIGCAASVPSTTPSISVEDAIAKAESALSGKFNEHPPTIEFVAKKDGSLALTHVMQIQNETTGAWFEAFVDAHSGELVQLTDFVAKASVSILVLVVMLVGD